MHALPRAFGPIALAATIAACGFDARPKSGAVACRPQGAACCPDGYICVGRGTSTDAGVSPGACWYKDDLPTAALVLAHDHTPALANDPGCLVTDWLPPLPGTGGAGGTLDGGRPDAGEQDVAPVDTGGTGPRLDAGADAPLGQDLPRDLWLGTGGSGGQADVPMGVDSGGVALDTAAERLPALLDGAVDAAMPPSIDGSSRDATPLDRAADAPLPLPDAALDAGIDAAAAADTSLALEVGRVDASPGIDGIVTSVAVSETFSCAVIRGGVKCWGSNDRGELGDGTTKAKSLPTPVPGLQMGATVVAAGWQHACAVVDGAVKCWGWNPYGQLGDGTTTDQRSPVPVVGLAPGATRIAAGNMHSCALVNGQAWCWGYNSQGQLGDGTYTNRAAPVAVLRLPSPVTTIACGANYSCAVASGQAFCWGENSLGQLGNGSQVPSYLPVPVVGMTSDVWDIAPGSQFGCAVAGGAAKCWGNNSSSGELGSGGDPYVIQYAPVAVVGLGAGVTRISSSQHTCAIVDSGLECWGHAAAGLGIGVLGDRATPVPVFAAGSGLVTVSVGLTHDCAATASALLCWGKNNLGQLGDGTTVDRLSPVNVALPE
jgi:alpha-tubulin suppressor-like RCC1 family protein